MYEKINGEEAKEEKSTEKNCYEKSIEEIISVRKPSYWNEIGTEPLKQLTIGDLIKEASEKFKHREAICTDERSRLTFEQAYEQVGIKEKNKRSLHA
ncbi:hypothetical protein PGB90_008903 [Kerria lacca]